MSGGGWGSATLSAIAWNSMVLRDAAGPRLPLLRHEGVLEWILLDSGLTVGARSSAAFVRVSACACVRAYLSVCVGGVCGGGG